MLGLFSSRLNWDPHPLTRTLVPEGGDTLASGRGGGGPNSDEGTDTWVLKAYIYFVVSSIE